MQAPTEVAIRIRPPFKFEHLSEIPCIFSIPNSNDLLLPNQEIFPCDYTFGFEVDQNHLYDKCVKPLIQHSLASRWDVNVIAFGPLSAGKSYTLFGPGLHYTHSETSYGIIPRVFRQVLSHLMGQSPYVTFKLSISVLEVINGHMRSLLEPTEYVKGSPLHIKSYEVCNVAHAISYLHIAMMNRRQYFSSAKTLSSASHCIVTLHIHQSWSTCSPENVEKCDYKISIVDLASLEESYFHNTNAGLITMSNLIGYNFNGKIQPLIDPVLHQLMEQILRHSCKNLVICCLPPATVKYVDILNHLIVINQMTQIRGQVMKKYDIERKLVRMLQEVHCDRHVDNGQTYPMTDDNVSFHAHQFLLHEDNQEADENYNFGLQFAATEMNKLVSNAEGLFHMMMRRSDLPEDFKQEIDQWINLKQEYESCMSSENNSTCGQTRMGLEKIEEVTESDDKNDNSSSASSDCCYSQSSIDSDSVSDSNSGYGIERPFLEAKKDELGIKSEFNIKIENLMERLQKSLDTNFDSTFNNINIELSPARSRKGDIYCRRKSILPGENPIGLDDLLKRNNSDLPLSKKLDTLNSIDICDEDEEAKCRPLAEEEKGTITQYNDLKVLSVESGSKQNQLDLVMLDVEDLTKRMGALQLTIDLKEQFINEMMKNCDIRSDAKARIERKHNQLESEYYKARSNLALAEKALHEENCSSNEQKVEKYRNISMQYERRLHNIQLITQIAGDSTKKVLELENSLQNSRRIMQKMLKQAKKDEDYKLCLEQKIKDQNKVKMEEEKCKSLKLKNFIDQKQEDTDMTGSQQLQEKLKEDSIKEEKQDKIASKNLIEVGARINQMEHVMKEKSFSNEEVIDVRIKEAVSHEIRNLRRTRDCLDAQRHSLVSKFNKEKVLSKNEERKFLECDEAIEAIDATIEYKSNVICGKIEENKSDKKNEAMLLARLSKLSVNELKSLLCKYFCKVIDLRESGRKMESQIAELDQTTEAHLLKIQTLSNALQQAHLEAERRMIIAQREHQEKLHLLYRHFADDSTGHSSSGTSSDNYLRVQNKLLKQQIVELESKLMQYTGGAIQPQSQQQLEGSSSSSCRTTRVTRHKNKLIIQQQKSKKPLK